MKTIIIPFMGFYESVHSELLDDAENQIFENGNGVCISENLQEKFYHVCDYSHARKEYIKAYATSFAKKVGLPLEFESLESPREYNFTTDRIFCNIDDVTIAKLFSETSTPTLRTVAVKNYTSRPGFYSFYDPDTGTWGDSQDWDCNQLATLLEAWMLDHFDDLCGAADGDTWTQWDEHEIMQEYNSSCRMDGWLCHAPEALRIANISSYLRTREERKYK